MQHRTSNIEHPTSNIQHRTSNIEHPTSNIQHRTETRSHLINIRGGMRGREQREMIDEKVNRIRWEAADLWTGYFVVRRSQPHFGDAPSSRLVAGPNLWLCHPRLFMRWLLLSLIDQPVVPRGI